MYVIGKSLHAAVIPSRRINGFSLIEMLIAVLVLSIGLLGMAGLQGYSLRNNNSAYHRTQANLLAYDILDAMRANRTAALANAYDVALGIPVTSRSTRALADLTDWKVNLAQSLPAGDGTVNCAANNPICTVTVQWDDTRGLGEGATQQLSLSTQL